MIDFMDSNGDKLISYKEASEFWQDENTEDLEDFNMADLNKDSFLSVIELERLFDEPYL